MYRHVYVIKAPTHRHEALANWYPIAVCELGTTAHRYAKENWGYDEGDYTVTAVPVDDSNNISLNYVPVIAATEEDREFDYMKDRRDKAIKKLKKAGLSEEEINALIKDAK